MSNVIVHHFDVLGYVVRRRVEERKNDKYYIEEITFCSEYGLQLSESPEQKFAIRFEQYGSADTVAKTVNALCPNLIYKVVKLLKKHKNNSLRKGRLNAKT